MIWHADYLRDLRSYLRFRPVVSIKWGHCL